VGCAEGEKPSVSRPPGTGFGAHTVLRIPAAHRRRLRTTNGLKRLNKEIKRRTRVATLFPNEASLPRLASAVLSEISDDWETERAYLNMEAR
jgi:putative transposase